MKSTTTIEPFGEPDNPEVIYFEEAKWALERIREYIEDFAESPGSATGIANLSEALDDSEYLQSLFEQDASPFSYHMMRRVRSRLGAVKHYYYEVARDADVKPDYLLGRNVERTIRSIEARIEEIEQCIEYASKNEPTEVEGDHRVSVTVFTGNGNEEKSIDGAVTNLYDDGSFDMLSDDGEAYHVDLSGDVVTGNGSKYPLALYQPRGE